LNTPRHRGVRDKFATGTTTILGGMLLELEEQDEQPHPWAFVCSNVGDCKAFHFSKAARSFTDITVGNCLSVSPNDPGGRLGPCLGKEGKPDLRNLSLHLQFCDEGDIIFICSDGVHDNLDPQLLGYPSSQFGLRGTWQKADIVDVNKVKDEWRSKFFLDQIVGAAKKDDITPAFIVKALMKHCRTTTKSSRDWMQVHPNERLPDDPTRFPGKMDHTTCVAFTVGKKTNLSWP